MNCESTTEEDDDRTLRISLIKKARKRSTGRTNDNVSPTIHWNTKNPADRAVNPAANPETKSTEYLSTKNPLLTTGAKRKAVTSPAAAAAKGPTIKARK